jgi:TIR domain
VFVSHGTQGTHGTHDGWIARRMARRIGETSVEAHIDNGDLRSGDDLREELSRLLARSDERVVLLTRFSMGRAWVWMEVGHMLFSRERVIPVLCGVSRKDLARSGGDGALANIVERQLNDFNLYVDELRRRVPHEA